MRASVALLLLAACATAPIAPTPPERVAGCWIDRGADGLGTTMRWLPDRARPGVLVGDLLEYRAEGQNHAARYTIEPRADHHVMCSHWQDEPICWKIAEGEGGSLEGGRVFVDAGEETLRIAVLSDGLEDVIFQGQRDGCD
ncbi:MAG: hypothetical protein NVV62_00320 [Terricaulis sp.]|nr:hypothetical protein [Terricaulis sp.]